MSTDMRNLSRLREIPPLSEVIRNSDGFGALAGMYVPCFQSSVNRIMSTDMKNLG